MVLQYKLDNFLFSAQQTFPIEIRIGSCNTHLQIQYESSKMFRSKVRNLQSFHINSRNSRRAYRYRAVANRNCDSEIVDYHWDSNSACRRARRPV